MSPVDRPVLAYLRQAERNRQTPTQDALEEGALPAPVLSALADTLDELHGRVSLGDVTITEAFTGTPVPGVVTALSRAAALARAAAVHGYPRPPLERLGHEAQAVPNARSTDPATSKAAGDEAHLTPKTTNHLGRLLVALHHDPRAGLTSEEAASRAGLPMTSEYAKRMSVLERLGYVAPLGQTRPGASGRERQVYGLTESGRILAAKLVRG